MVRPPPCERLDDLPAYRSRIRSHRVESRLFPRCCPAPRSDPRFLREHRRQGPPVLAGRLPFAEAAAVAGVRLMGHQQVTDADLLGLAIRRSGVLATLDDQIGALAAPKSVERKALETVV